MMGRLCFLIGAPHCGKSTLGRRVAELMRLQFFDTDEIVRIKMDEARSSNVFGSYSHAHFREGQLNAILNLCKFNDAAIIATGAEAALIPGCVEAMKDNGYIIHIKRKVENILEELRGSVYSRPVMVEVNNGTILDLREHVVLAYVDELPYYEVAADLTVDNNGSVDDGVELLSSLIQAIMKNEGD